MKDVSNRGTGSWPHDESDEESEADGLENVIFDFEGVGDLGLLPLAARRALDVAGYRLSLEGWRSMAIDERRDLTLEGGRDVVDPARVGELVRSASTAATRIRPVPDPDPLLPPEQLPSFLGVRRPIDPAQWTRLRALDRYALVHVLRRSIAHDDPRRLEAALGAILPNASVRPPAERTASARPGTRSAAPAAGPRSTGKRSPAALPATERRVPLSSRADPREDAPPRDSARARATPVSQRGRTGAPGSDRSNSSQPSPRSKRGRDLADDDSLEVAYSPSGGRSERATYAPDGADDDAPDSGHFSPSGKARMIDVGDKPSTLRRAVASGCVHMLRSTAERLARGDVPKGEALAVARVAGIMAAKRTANLIPLCHAVPLSRVEVHLAIDEQRGRVVVEAEAEAFGPTGVEMEALTATSVACLTLYDMLKSFDREMIVSDIKLLEKTGGRRGPYSRDD